MFNFNWRRIASIVSLLIVLMLSFGPISAQDEYAGIRTHALKLNVDDMQTALLFYVEKLGFEVEDRSKYPQAVILRTGDRIKLILNLVKAVQMTGPKDTQVGLTLQVNDLERSITGLKSQDVKFAESEPRKEAVGNAITILDPFGRRISLMHQTIVKVEPFKEPRIYNFGLLIPDMNVARTFYAGKLGFVVRSEKYLPLDLPLGHKDKSFGFMLHLRSGVQPVRSNYPSTLPYYTIVFETENMRAVIEAMNKTGIEIVSREPGKNGKPAWLSFRDPFGNISELKEVRINPTEQTLRDLYNNKQYFDLRDALRDQAGAESPELLFYRGVVNNKFNQPRLSIRYLNSYLKRVGDSHSRQIIEAYETLADNYRKTFQYRKASEAYRIILTRFANDIDESRKRDCESEFKLWGALASVPPQTTTLRGDSIINRDRDGHVPLKIDGHQLALMFDTGANLSVIRQSLATKFGLKVIQAPIGVDTVAGLKVRAHLAVARRIELGKVVVRNAVFLVFPDKDLYISEANFQLDGVIGFPVIAALREVTFERRGRLLVPVRPGNGGEQNMSLAGFSPLIAGWFKGQRFTFAFDTGANASTLYPPFFKSFRTDIEGRFDHHTQRVTGVGGYREIKGYLARDLVLTFSGKQARYDQVPILIEKTTENSQYFYGNLGTDLMEQFEKMTLNFVTMSIVFE